MILYGSLAHHDRHSNWPGHPERPERLVSVDRVCLRKPACEFVVPLEARPATRQELGRVHSEFLLDSLAALSQRGGGEIDPDTAMSKGSWETAVAGAGMGLAAVEALETGGATAAFLALRPPGHHASSSRSMGFCLLNNVAVTAAALAADGSKVMVFDWDVHHGNGTQDIFWNDPRVLYVSTHQWPAYPGSGRAAEIGGPAAPGLTLNIPLPAGATGDVARLALDEVIGPAVCDFRPDWLLISAGYDAHRADPLADLAWSAGDYGELTREVLSLVDRPGRTIAFLEGGYDLEALARSASATVFALAGVSAVTEAPTSGGPGREAVAAAARLRDRALEDLAASS